jgi:hypothetical protein
MCCPTAASGLIAHQPRTHRREFQSTTCILPRIAEHFGRLSGPWRGKVGRPTLPIQVHLQRGNGGSSTARTAQCLMLFCLSSRTAHAPKPASVYEQDSLPFFGLCRSWGFASLSTHVAQPRPPVARHDPTKCPQCGADQDGLSAGCGQPRWRDLASSQWHTSWMSTQQVKLRTEHMSPQTPVPNMGYRESEVCREIDDGRPDVILQWSPAWQYTWPFTTAILL